jgi:thimet oligopeptidase
VKGKRTVENTLAPFDRAYDELQEAEEFANLVQNVHPDKAFRGNATAMVTKVSSRQSAMALNPGLCQALRSMDVSAADEATKYYVSASCLSFDLPAWTRMRLHVRG